MSLSRPPLSRTSLWQKLPEGLIAGTFAYLCWGFFPVYFKMTAEVGPLEVLAHRVVWSLPFGLLIIWFRNQWQEIGKAFKSKKVLYLLTISAFSMTVNWGVYIWAVQDSHVFQASLGYYINPLMYMMVGVIFFGEKMTRTQGAAIVLAALGVAILTLYGGVFPSISMILAISFTIYGVIRKQVEIGAMPGLLIEVLILFLPALGYLLYLNHTGLLSFAHQGLKLDLLLIFAGPMTVIPLVLFAVAARKLPFATIGFLQFIAPSLQFACGVYYGEVFTPAHAICFSLIWLAVILYIYGSARKYRLSK